MVGVPVTLLFITWHIEHAEGKRVPIQSPVTFRRYQSDLKVESLKILLLSDLAFGIERCCS